MVGGHYKGRIYGTGTTYCKSYSPALCLELGLLVSMWRRSVIGCMHWTNQCKGSSRRSTRDTWSYRSGTRRKKSSELATTVHRVEDNDYVHLLRANAEWRFVVWCTVSTIAASTSTSTFIASTFSPWPHTRRFWGYFGYWRWLVCIVFKVFFLCF